MFVTAEMISANLPHEWKTKPLVVLWADVFPSTEYFIPIGPPGTRAAARRGEEQVAEVEVVEEVEEAEVVEEEEVEEVVEVEVEDDEDEVEDDEDDVEDDEEAVEDDDVEVEEDEAWPDEDEVEDPDWFPDPSLWADPQRGLPLGDIDFDVGQAVAVAMIRETLQLCVKFDLTMNMCSMKMGFFLKEFKKECGPENWKRVRSGFGCQSWHPCTWSSFRARQYAAFVLFGDKAMSNKVTEVASPLFDLWRSDWAKYRELGRTLQKRAREAVEIACRPGASDAQKARARRLRASAARQLAGIERYRAVQARIRGLPVGVRKRLKGGGYGVEIYIEGRHISMGTYDTEEEAARIFDLAWLTLPGRRAEKRYNYSSDPPPTEEELNQMRAKLKAKVAKPVGTRTRMKAENNLAENQKKAELYRGVRYHGSKFIAQVNVLGTTLLSPSFCTAEEAAWAYNKICLANRADLPRFNLENLNHVEGNDLNTLPGYQAAKEEAKEAAGMKAENNPAENQKKAKLYRGVSYQCSKFIAQVKVSGTNLRSPHFCTAEQAAWAFNEIYLANRADLPRFNLENLNHVEGNDLNTLPGYQAAKEEEAKES